jgi:hypothetical protein
MGGWLNQNKKYDQVRAVNKIYTFDSLQRERGVKDAERLAYIDFFLRFKGTLSRNDLTSFFGLKEAAASQTISQYRELRPLNVEYHRGIGKNAILRSSFEPLIEIEAEMALGMLANGFNKNKLLDDCLLPYARIGNSPKKLNVDLVSKVTRAICEKSAISCKYFSATSNNHGERVLFPTAIFYDGISWMFRAFHKDMNTHRGLFKCFDFSRLVSVDELHTLYAEKGEDLEGDADWHLTTPIILKVHPHLSDEQKKVLRYDFDISQDSDELAITTKAVLFYYLVKQWKIDVRTELVDVEKIKKEEQNYYNFHLQNRSSLKHLHCMQHVFDTTQ